MSTSLSPDSKLIQGCRPDCPLLDSCRAQGLKRCPMRVKAPTISFPLIYSLVLHTIVACIILMLPIYGGSAGQRSFMSYLVFLTGGEEPAQAPVAPDKEKLEAVRRTVKTEKTGPGKVAKPEEKAVVEKTKETPEKKVFRSPTEDEAHSVVAAADNALQNVPAKTGDVKADTGMAVEAVRQSAEPERDEKVEEGHVSSAWEPSSLLQEPPVPPWSSTETPLPIPGAGQLGKEILPDTEALLQYHGTGKEKGPPASEKAQPPAAVSNPAREQVTSQGAPAPPRGTGGNVGRAVEGKSVPQNKSGEVGASKAAAEKGQIAEVVPPAGGQEGVAGTAPLPVSGGGSSAGGQQTALEAVSAAQVKEEKAVEPGPVEKWKTTGETKPAPVGIAGAAALLPRDIRIEVVVSGEDGSSVLTRLYRRNYPPASPGSTAMKDQPVKAEEESGSDGSGKMKRMLSVVKADKGIYTFVIGNEGRKTCIADAAFFLFERTTKGRKKEYKAVQLPPGTGVKFKFLVPDAIFWDDEDRFSGSTEDSDSITKFNSDTGLIWRERKDE
jgi:hypothetical protein